MLADHNLTASGWSFDFDNAQRRLGICVHSRRQITISRHMTGAATEEQFSQTMLHEIAHALIGSSAGHGPLWKSKARSIGYNGGRTTMNPYRRPGSVDPTTLMPSNRPTYVPGQMLDLPRGQVGPIVSIGPSRYKVRTERGAVWFVPFAIAKLSTAPAPVVDTFGSPRGNPIPYTFTSDRRLPIGTRLKLNNGVEGKIVKIARVQYHVSGDDGRIWGVRFGSARPIEAGTFAAVAASSPPTISPAPAAITMLPLGTKLRLHNGKIATITKIARTRYHAETEAGVGWTVPFRAAVTA